MNENIQALRSKRFYELRSILVRSRNIVGDEEIEDAMCEALGTSGLECVTVEEIEKAIAREEHYLTARRAGSFS
ncbi:MAG: hypothetical protein CVU77_04455 [Elusimicrobia bacterium HGW-Elusimicrobia-1]|jgi:hypothetical protein|nr:MAG: hypothetical protein CVU77_04455 [Elusimicrobia bacterium HGW-Elusimicrobia-1]